MHAYFIDKIEKFESLTRSGAASNEEACDTLEVGRTRYRIRQDSGKLAIVSTLDSKCYLAHHIADVSHQP